MGKLGPGSDVGFAPAQVSSKLSVTSAEQLAIYHRHTWLAAALFAFAVLFMEAVIMGLSIYTESEAPVLLVSEAGNSLVEAYNRFEQIPASSTATLPAMQALLKRYVAFVKMFLFAKERSEIIWEYQLICSCIHYFIFIVVVFFAIFFRNLKALITRGRQFQVHFFLSGALTLIFSTVMTAAFMLQFTDFPPATDLTAVDEMRAEEAKLTNILYAFVVLNVFSSCFFLGAMVQRLLFISESYRGFHGKHYMLTFPIHVFVAFLACVGTTVWRFQYNLTGDKSMWGQSTVWVIVPIYLTWATYCIAKTHPGHVQYGDVYCNARVIAFYALLNISLSIHNYNSPRSIINFICGWAAISRATVTYACLDNLWCHFVQTRYELKAILYT